MKGYLTVFIILCLLKSTNGQWQKLSCPDTSSGFNHILTSGNNYYLAAANKLYTSTDTLKTWSVSTSPLTSFFSLAVYNNYIYGTCYTINGVVRFKNNLWEYDTIGLMGTIPKGVSRAGNSLYLPVEAPGGIELFRKTGADSTWKLVPSIRSNVNDVILASNNKYYASGPLEIWESVDGINFTLINSTTMPNTTHIKNTGNYLYAVSYYNGIYKSDNWGLSWNRIDKNKGDNFPPNSFGVNGSSLFYVQPNSSGIKPKLFLSMNYGTDWLEITDTSLIPNNVSASLLIGKDVFITQNKYGFPVEKGTENCLLNYNYGTLGVNDIRLEKSFKCYPNPTNKFITIQSSSAFESNEVVEIYDMCGRKVFSQYVNSHQVGAFNISLSIEELNSGVYFIKLKNRYQQILIER